MEVHLLHDNKRLGRISGSLRIRIRKETGVGFHKEGSESRREQASL